MKKKNYYIKIKLLLILVIFIISLGTSYAYLATNLKITGKLSTKSNIGSEVDPSLSYSISHENSWVENGLYYYQYTFRVKNIGTVEIDNFQLFIEFSKNIQSITSWDHKFTSTNKSITITNDKYNLKPGETNDVGITLSTNHNNIKITFIKLTTNTSTTEVDTSKFLINFSITSSWGKYTYQYNVSITNKTGVKITYWEFDIILPEGTKYSSGWNAIFTKDNNVINIKNASYNGYLENNSSTSIGLQIETNINNFIPTVKNIKVR